MSDTFTDKPVFFDLDVSEMTVTESLDEVVRLPKTTVQELLDEYEDEKPQFPVLKIEAGLSGNDNNWPDTVLANVAEQINRDAMPGYWGHISPERRGYEFPDPETYWLGAKVKNEGGKQVLYVKGYNIPGSRARRHRRLARVVSWAGKASGRVVNGVRHITSFQLESIDWARPGSQGMNAAVVGYATEMEGSDNVEVNWATVTLDDIQKNNPSLYTLMRKRVEDEMASDVTEMKEKAERADEADGVFAKLRKLLKIDDKTDIVEAVTEAVTKVEKIGQGELRERIASMFAKKLGDKEASKSARQTLLRLFPVTEMVDKTDDEIETAVTEFIEKDDEAKVIVTEMVQSPAPLHGRSGDNGRKSNVGGSGMVRETVTKL